MATGSIKLYNEAKGFGFIRPDDGGNDIFVRAVSLPKGCKVQEGQKVLYNLVNGNKGPEAVDVQPE